MTEASGGAGARATAAGEGAGVWKPSEGSRERDRALEADKSERDCFTWGPAAVYCAQSVVIVGPLKEAVSLQKSRYWSTYWSGTLQSVGSRVLRR